MKYVVLSGKTFNGKEQGSPTHISGDIIELDPQDAHTQWSITNGMIAPLSQAPATFSAQGPVSPQPAQKTIAGNGTIQGKEIIESKFKIAIEWMPGVSEEEMSKFVDIEVKKMLDGLEEEPEQVPAFIKSVTIARNI